MSLHVKFLTQQAARSRWFRRPSGAGLLLFAMAFFLPFTRVLSGVNLVVLSVLFLCYLLISKNLGSVPRSLWALSGLGVLYALLSTIEIFPAAWTQIFDAAAIPQQALFAYAMPPTFGVLVIYLKGNLSSAERRIEAAKKLVWIWIAWKMFYFLSNPEDISLAELLSISQTGNATSVIIVAACLYLSTVSSSFKRGLVIFIFVMLSALSSFSQNFVYAFAFALVWIFPRQALGITSGFLISSVFVYAIFFTDPVALQPLDNNMPIRLILIRDALAGLVQSHGLGVGFGTESITNDYARLGILHFQSSDHAGFIHLAAHNSFATIPFRLGILGFFILILFCSQTFRKIRNSDNERDIQAKCALFIAFFTVTFTNPGLESFAFLYGACLYLAAIWAFPLRNLVVERRTTF